MDESHDELITQFVGVTGASAATAQAALQSTNWNLNEAVTFFFASQDQPADEDDEEEEMADDEPAQQPAPSGSRAARPPSSRPTRPPPNQSRLRTLKDIQGGNSAGGSDDEDDENNPDLFAGGEKSGLAVQNPNNSNNSTDHFNNIISQAKQHRERPEGDDEPSRTSHFTSRGQTLGGDDAPSQVVNDTPAPAAGRAGLPRVERTLHLWQDGFSVDDGPLYRFDDPANAPTLALINQGRAPLALLGVQPGQEVDLNLNPHKDEKYVQPKQKYKPFGGSGQRLGSPTPGVAAASSAQSQQPTATASNANVVAPKPVSSGPTMDVDDSQPTLALQIRLGDGSRLQQRFNATHTIGDVYDFVTRAHAGSASRGFVLMTTFPSKELSDKSSELGSMAETKKGGVVVQKWT